MRSTSSPRRLGGQTQRLSHRRRRSVRPPLDWAADAIDRGWILMPRSAPSPRSIDRRTRLLRRAGALADLAGANLGDATLAGAHGDWRDVAGAQS